MVVKIPRRKLNDWILYSVRETFEDESCRNSLLRFYLEDIPDIEYGPTFVGKYEEAASYIKTLQKSTVLFTVANIPDEESKQTHYQSFILRNKTVWIFDPARTSRGEGIYNPYAANYLMRTFRKSGSTVKWFVPKNPCQTEDHDVFCQTWSLYLQINFMLNGEVVIPKNYCEKYQLLLTFIKNALSDSFFSETLHINYKEAVDYAVSNIKQPCRNLVRNEYLSYNPCNVLKDMRVGDMFPNKKMCRNIL